MSILKEELEGALRSNIDAREQLKSGLYGMVLNVPESNRLGEHHPTEEAIKLFERNIAVLEKAIAALPAYQN